MEFHNPRECSSTASQLSGALYFYFYFYFRCLVLGMVTVGSCLTAPKHSNLSPVLLEFTKAVCMQLNVCGGNEYFKGS